MLIWHKEQLPDEEGAYLQRLCNHEADDARAYEVALAFAAMARERKGQAFEARLASVADSGIADLRRFASRLADDRAAVKAGLTQAWSNGQTEGRVNEPKRLMRSMCGRTNFDLLRLRVLHAA